MRVVELFCGAGGMSRGLKDAGLEVVRAYDSWPIAVANYNANLSDHAVVRDLSDVLSVIPEILALAPDVIAGGPPCSDFSVVGRRKDAARAQLLIAYATICAVVRPKWIVMENVIPALKSPVWQQACDILRRAGYGLTASKVNAAHYGAPQNRKRLIVIGRLGEQEDFMASAVAAATSPQPMTLRQFFDDGHPDDAALIAKGYVYSRPVREGRGVRSIDEAFPCVVRTAHGRPTSRYLNRPHIGDPVPALETAVLTVRQMSMIQTFPEGWVWTGNKHDRLQMIANAVPCALAEALGRVILERERGQSAPMVIGEFTKWLVRRGRSPHSARNTKSLSVRARRLLRGRTFVDPVLELAALEAVPEVQIMRKNTLSDLRQALKLYAEFQSSPKPRARMHYTKTRQDAAVVQLQDYARRLRDADVTDDGQETRKLASGVTREITCCRLTTGVV